MSVPTVVRVIVYGAHDTTHGRIYEVDKEDSEDCFTDEKAVWIKEDDVGEKYYLYENEFEVVA